MQLSRRSIVKSRNARASVGWHTVVSSQSESSDAGGCSYGLNSHVELWCANDIGNSLSSDNDFACRFLEAKLLSFCTAQPEDSALPRIAAVPRR